MAKPKVAFMTSIPDDMLEEIIPEFPSDLDVTVVRRGQPEEEQVAACKDPFPAGGSGLLGITKTPGNTVDPLELVEEGDRLVFGSGSIRAAARGTGGRSSSSGAWCCWWACSSASSARCGSAAARIPPSAPSASAARNVGACPVKTRRSSPRDA